MDARPDGQRAGAQSAAAAPGNRAREDLTRVVAATPGIEPRNVPPEAPRVAFAARSGVSRHAEPRDREEPRHHEDAGEMF